MKSTTRRGRALSCSLVLAIGVLCGMTVAGCAKHAPAAGPVVVHQAGGHAPASNPGVDEAFQRLKDGNARFVSGQMRHPHEETSWRGALEKGQHPFATVIGCSDSRVPLELLFDQGFGDLFVIRVAGNLVTRDEAGSIEYAVLHLHTPVVAIIGHEKCGAVTAALGTHEEITREPQELSDLLATIHVGMPEIPAALPQDQRVILGVEANVRHAMRQLAHVTAIHEAVAAGRTRIVGGIYTLHSGEVRWLE